ncbi:MAG: penicillin acylase family protein [Dehalococcoidia bacterium]
MRRYFVLIPLFALIIVGGLFAADGRLPAKADPGAITVRESAYGLPHIYADTDLELARENGREIAKDRLGQIILIGRVARGTLYQAFGPLDPGTFNDDVEVRRDGYTSSELNEMYTKLPQDVQDLLLEYAKGVNDTIEAVYAGTQPKPLEVNLLQSLGLGDDLFGNKTNISDQADPYYAPAGGAYPHSGFQFTPEMAIAIAVLQVRNFGSEDFGEVSRMNELNNLVTKFGTGDGTQIWDDLNFLNDPLAPVSVPDATTPGFGGPLASSGAADEAAKYVGFFPQYDFDDALAQLEQDHAHRQEFAERMGAWPKLGSYAWLIDGDLSNTGNPWLGGFPQTGEQTPSIMHFAELRSAEGSDHQIEAMGMEFVGAPIVLIGQTDSVAWTSTTAQLKNNDFYLEKIILENTDALSYDDEGTPAPMSMRTEQIRSGGGSNTPYVAWRTHERAANGGSRTVEAFQGNAGSTVDAADATSLTDNAAFTGSYGGGYVAIIAGPGSGQIRPILSNTTNVLTLAGGDAWTTTPTTASRYVAVRSGNDIVAVSRDRVFWLEESLTAYAFTIFQRAENVLDIRRGSRLIPSTHNFPSVDNKAFNGYGTDLGPGTGNIAYYSTGFSRIRQGGSATDTRLPLDGTQPNQLVVVSGTVGSSGNNSLTDTAAFTGEDFSPPVVNYRLDNPSQQGSEYIVSITGGTGYKQTRRIASNDDDTLTLEEDWGVNPQPGDLYEVYEIVAMPEAINPPNGYTANWNNKAATADDGRTFGRQHRVTFILERLAADSTWTRAEQRQLNKDLAGLDGKGKFGAYLIPRLRQAVDASCSGGVEDTVVAALEAYNDSPEFGRGFIDPINDTMIAGEGILLGGNPFGPEPTDLIRELAKAILTDEFSGTGVGVPGGEQGLALVQHAIDSAAGTPSGAYVQSYSGDYFNGVPWEDVVCSALATTITAFGGGIPADAARPNNTFAHPLSPLFPQLVFDPVPTGNRGAYEQIVEVGPTVLGEFIFPLGQSGFIDTDGISGRHTDSLHEIWADWRFWPMLHIAEDLSVDPDGDVDNDGVLDGYEKWYYGSNSVAATDDSDADFCTVLCEYLAGTYADDSDSDDNGTLDGAEDPDKDGCVNAKEAGPDQVLGGRRDPLSIWDVYDTQTNSGGSGLAAGSALVGSVEVSDIINVVKHFGQSGNRGIDPLSDASNPAVYHTRFDRNYAASGSDPWDLRGPDGAIVVGDLFGSVIQFGHHC